MKKLLAMYQSLPKEVQVMVAMAGLGTPIGIIYLLQRWVLPGVPVYLIILGVALVLVVLTLIAAALPKLFNRAARKRTKRMENELASTAEAGPVSMDLRAAIKSNNEKFFTAIKEMRKLGISVYDLPWYVVIGDSGCGKTKLINEGGLTFSTGKPEGYQLGTLNYNWWFTEDAIFVDMAGRLCNPKDDTDYREWEAFLKTVGQGRRGFPINGVLLCVSAEHLLQEPPEQHEADANTMLERLRDLQSKLGVTFATYLVVTKCDKIVGFMQFFDRAERDITIKNQIFGWSRPGEFNELRDPETFGADFDGVYARLNELRLRRLNDDVDEFELGLAYSFPEEYRELKEPLQTYVRTLFPAIKNPRAVKNLIFRGVYFTSATQQGSLILKHLAERLGADAASQFPPLESMYPRPRPHFVKDLLFRKVFPEQGLVFRNEQEVLRNRRLARGLTIGTVVLAVLLAVTLFTSFWKFGQLITEPLGHANESRQAVTETEVAKPLKLVDTLGQDVHKLRGSYWPSLLSLGWGADRPVEYLTRVQMRLFEQTVVRWVLARADVELRKVQVVPAGGDAKSGVAFSEYGPALEQYVTWYGCAPAGQLPTSIDYASFDKLAGVIPMADAIAAQREQLRQSAEQYFRAIQAAGDWGNPARLLLGKGFQPRDTIAQAVLKTRGYFEAFATLNEKNPNPIISRWMRVRDRCAQIEQAYQAILAAAKPDLNTEEEFAEFQKTFNQNYNQLTKAMDECNWPGDKTGGPVRIPPLRHALLEQRQVWENERDLLRQAYRGCGQGSAADDPVNVAIGNLADGPDGLDVTLARNLKDAGLSEQGYFANYYHDFDTLVQEVDQRFSDILVLTRGAEGEGDRLGVAPALSQTVRPALDQMHERLAALETDSASATMQNWITTLEGLLFPAKDATEPMKFAGPAELPKRWESGKLAALGTLCQELVRKGTGTAVLRAIETRLPPTGAWSLAELAPDWRATVTSTYMIPVPAASQAPTAPQEPTAPPPVVQPQAGPPPVIQPTKPGGAPALAPTPAPPSPAGRAGGPGQIPKCASPEFLNARALECVRLLRYLTERGRPYYFVRAGDTTPLNERCSALVDAAWQRYCKTYVSAWNDAYGNAALPRLERLARWNDPWEAFAAQFRGGSAAAESDARAAVAGELQPALAEILHATRWATYASEGGWWLAQRDDYYGAQKTQVAAGYDAALTASWTRGGFARDANLSRPSPVTEARPWDALASETVERWASWCGAVGGAAKLPHRFEVSDPAPKLPTIPWDGLPALRAEAGLRDERLTQQVVDFQRKAEDLLSAELTGIYCTLQSDAFAEQKPYGGWPYVNEQGSDLTALETVAFDPFAKFLGLVQRADAELQPLEQGLPDDEVYRARRAFVRSCEAWRAFLGLNAQGGTTPLEVTVWTEDPLAEPFGQEKMDDTAQQYYGNVQLNIGLRMRQGDTTTIRPLEFQPGLRGRDRSVPAVWEWSRPPDQTELTFTLVDGIQPEGKQFKFPPIKPRTLGKASRLAFCAFLHRYGNEVDANWFVSLAVNLPEMLKAAGHAELVSEVKAGGSVIGVKFVFSLPSGRDLPAPILRLSPAAPATSGRH